MSDADERAMGDADERAMSDADKSATRREILEDVADLLHDELAADAWGRLLLEVMRGPSGAPVATGASVEELFGDEARVETAFDEENARDVMPVLANAVEALCLLDGLELEDVRGGTFVRAGTRADERVFAWLPGLVHAPSPKLDRERDALLRALRVKNDGLGERFGFPAKGTPQIDLAAEALAFDAPGKPRMKARATLLGTFAPASRTWGWGGTNPHVPDGVARAAAEIVDMIPDRDLWEISTPVFATDEVTAWALAAFVCDRAGGDGVYAAREGDGLVFILLRDVGE
jgi:hypothetical protein